MNSVPPDYFETFMGVKQEKHCPFLLFVFLVSDKYESLQTENIDFFISDEFYLFLLLFSDDTT